MANIDKNCDIPKFLLDKRYLSGSVFFIFLFSVLFMFLYSPFSMTSWLSLTDVQHAGMTLSFYVVAVAILLVSKSVMSMVQSRMRITYSRYIVWILAEVVIIALFYTYYTSVFVPTVTVPIWQVMAKALGCVLLIVAIPYAILMLYAAYKDKSEELEMLQYKLSLMEEHSVTYPSLVNLYDYNGQLKLTIQANSLYYMESQDNYIKVHYKHRDAMHCYMLRCSTKALEESLADTTLVRCHRSFLVNVMQINHIKRGRQGRYVVLEDKSLDPIPVSRGYLNNLVEKVDAYNKCAAALVENPDEAPAVSE